MTDGSRHGSVPDLSSPNGQQPPSPDLRLTTQDILRYLDSAELPANEKQALGQTLYGDRQNRALQTFLRNHGVRIALHASDVTPMQFRAIQKIYRNETFVLLAEDPFQTIGRVRGMNYDRASRLWRRFGQALDDSTAALAAVREIIRQGRDHGDVWLNRATVIARAQSLCGKDRDLITAALDHYIVTGGLSEITDRGRCLLVRTPALETERTIAARLRLLDGRYPRADRFSIYTAMRGAGILNPDPMQMEAVALALEHQLCLITGGPGTGKSTILQAIRMILEEEHPGVRLHLVALAARVAREVGAKTGITADTVHKTLGVGAGGAPLHGPGMPLPMDVVFIEEAFMLGNNLFADLLAAIGPKTRVIIVGDPEQLPPILEGKPVEAMLASERISSIRLTTNHRSDSADIPQAGQSVMKGRMFRETQSVRRIPATGIDDALAQTRALFQNLRNRGDTVQILTAMHQGHLGTAAINHAIAGRREFSVGDAVMQTENDRERNVFNGEIGTIVEVDQDIVIVEREDGTRIPYDKIEQKQIVHAWAITYHKSQGLEYDHVVLITSQTQARMLSRNLINVGITRARRTCTIIDHRNGLRTAIAREISNRRTSLLDRIIRGEI